MPKKAKRKTWLAFGCIHQPNADSEAVAWLIDEIRDRAPDVVVNLGDLIDSACLSTFEKTGDESTLKNEFDKAGEFLQQIKDARPRATRIFMMGNHDQRFARPMWNKLSSLLDYRTQIKECSDWQHFEYRQHPDATYKLGQVSFYHGFTAGRGALKGESIRLGVPYGLTVGAHTHRPTPVTKLQFGAVSVPYWMANTGTMIAECEYIATKNSSEWGQAIVVGSCDPNIRHDGQRHWEAETVIRRMQWDD
jgi:predicted phosphodiesterase